MKYQNEADFRELVREKLVSLELKNEAYLDIICNGMFAKVLEESLGSCIVSLDDIELQTNGNSSYMYEFNSGEYLNVIDVSSKENGVISLRAALNGTNFYAIVKGDTLKFGSIKKGQTVETKVTISNNEVKNIEVTRSNAKEKAEQQSAFVEPIGVKLKSNEYYSYKPNKHNVKTPILGGLIHKIDRSSRIMSVATSRDVKESISYIPNIIESTIQEMDKDIALKEVKKRRLHK